LKNAKLDHYLDLLGDKKRVRIKLDDHSLENFERAMLELAELEEGKKIMKKYGIGVICL